MMTRTAEHVNTALHVGLSLLLTGALGVLVQKRRNRERASLEDSRAHELQLRQKDLLIREVHHRVANQMGLTAALLHLQAARSMHPDTKAHLFDSENRIRTLSKLHARLHLAEPHNRTLLYPFLSELASDLISTLRPDLVYFTEISNDSPVTKSCTAITYGLLVHELVTNCIKHAFPKNRQGTIRLSLHRPHPDRLRISILDDGAGLPAGFTLHDPPTTGMAIIFALTKELAGTFSAIQHLSGTEFIAEFPLLEISTSP
ncbi:MAG: sensor histidine kinase [bacterium]|jgi:two-component sensor histidine kinase